VISGALNLMKKNRNVFDDLSRINSKCIDVIEKDLKRTFMLKETNIKYEHKLRKILIAFSNFDPQIGYTQGMNYIAGFILRQYFEYQTKFNELNEFNESTEYEIIDNIENATKQKQINDSLILEKSFWTFVSVMNKIGTLFSDRLPGFHKSVQCFKKILSYHGPNDLVTHLNEYNVYPIILSCWYHSLFTYPSMNVIISKRIWDVFLVEQLDFSIIIKISYLIVIRHKKKLINSDFVSIIEFCKSKNCFLFNNQNDHDLIYRARNLQLNELYLKPIRQLKYIELHNNSNENINKKHSKTKTYVSNVSNTVSTLFDSYNSNATNNINNINVSSSSVKLNGIVTPTKEDGNAASKSWANLLTFGFVK